MSVVQLVETPSQQCDAMRGLVEGKIDDTALISLCC